MDNTVNTSPEDSSGVAVDPVVPDPVVKVTAAVGAWLNALVKHMVAALAAAGKVIPDFHVSLVANPKGPRLRLKSKAEDGTVTFKDLKLPCFIIAPLSGETATALGLDFKTGQPDPNKTRTLKVAPRYTLDRTYRGMIDITCSADQARDTKNRTALSERLFALVAHLAASVNVPPRCATNVKKSTNQTISKMIQQPSGWKVPAAILGLAVQQSEGDDIVKGEGKYTLTDRGLQAARAFITANGPFPLSGLGAFDSVKDDRPKRWVVAMNAADGTAVRDDNGKPFKLRVPGKLWARLAALGIPLTVQLITKQDEQSEPIVASLATNVTAKADKPEPAAVVGAESAAAPTP